jgi:hypothetical protein
VAYVGRPGATSEERTAVSIVITQPERLMPRRLLRVQKRMFATGWPDYQCWVLAWDDQALTNVRMGDEPYDLVRSHGVYETEGEARADAKRWLVEQANAVAVEDISYFDLPGIARSVLLYAVRRGPGYFGL